MKEISIELSAITYINYEKDIDSLNDYKAQ